MDLKLLEYMVKIEEERSITRAAEKLYITQSALNQQLLRLEKELGTPLFYRTRSDWSPTPPGEVYLKGAREILQIKKHTYNQINDILHTSRGHLSIGFTPLRGADMFTWIYPDFHKLFPQTVVDPHEMSVHQQQKLISSGLLDLGFQTLSPQQRTSDEYIKLGEEELFLVLPEDFPFDCPPKQEGAAFPEAVDLNRLRYEPFVLMYRESTTRPLIDQIFKNAGFSPNTLFDTSSNQTIISMVQNRLCCGIVPWYYLQNRPKGISIYAFPEHPSLDIVVSYHKNTYLSAPAQALIQLAKTFWDQNTLK